MSTTRNGPANVLGFSEYVRDSVAASSATYHKNKRLGQHQVNPVDLVWAWGPDLPITISNIETPSPK
jgi:hypothetical protein